MELVGSTPGLLPAAMGALLQIEHVPIAMKLQQLPVSPRAGLPARERREDM
jgi:hypothetical protein